MARLRIPVGTVISDVAHLVSAVAWPLVIVGVLWFLREPLRALAHRIGSSAQRVSIGAQGLTVELGSAIEAVPSQAATALAGVRAPEQAPRVVDSAAMTMFAQLQGEAPAPYLVVDLGEGREWLTSRLYIFAILLRAMRQTGALLFVETVAGVRGRFVGLASPEHVRWALAHAYPWLEADYATAYAQATTARQTSNPNPNPNVDPFVLDDNGRLAQEVAHQVATNFVFAVQVVPPGAAVPTTTNDQWVVEDRPDGKFIEHAKWLTGAELERVLGSVLHRFAYLVETVPRSPAEVAREAVRVHGEDVVALVDDQHRFRDMVVNRRDVLETLAINTGANAGTERES
jgi:hypothetical protein